MRLLLHILTFWIFTWRTLAQDIMTPTVDILTELQRLRSIEEKLKVVEDEVKELRRENQEQAKELEVLRGNVSRMDEQAQKDTVPKVAFSATLLDTKESKNLGPFGKRTQLIYKHVFTNVGEAYNPATGIFTVPLKGVYVFRIFSKAVGKPGVPVTAGLFKNDQHIFSTHGDQASGFYSTSNGMTLPLEKGDSISVQLYGGAWIYDNGEHHHSSFSGHLLFTL